MAETTYDELLSTQLPTDGLGALYDKRVDELALRVIEHGADENWLVGLPPLFKPYVTAKSSEALISGLFTWVEEVSDEDATSQLLSLLGFVAATAYEMGVVDVLRDSDSEDDFINTVKELVFQSLLIHDRECAAYTEELYTFHKELEKDLAGAGEENA